MCCNKQNALNVQVGFMYLFITGHIHRQCAYHLIKWKLKKTKTKKKSPLQTRQIEFECNLSPMSWKYNALFPRCETLHVTSNFHCPHFSVPDWQYPSMATSSTLNTHIRIAKSTRMRQDVNIRSKQILSTNANSNYPMCTFLNTLFCFNSLKLDVAEREYYEVSSFFFFKLTNWVIHDNIFFVVVCGWNTVHKYSISGFRWGFCFSPNYASLFFGLWANNYARNPINLFHHCITRYGCYINDV